MTIKNGFTRFCDDPDLACCRAEAELGRLRMENAQLHAKLSEAERRERAMELVGSPVKVKAFDPENEVVLTYSALNCPKCGTWLTAIPSKRYCGRCGQRLEVEP